jgi:hypothetical protein
VRSHSLDDASAAYTEQRQLAAAAVCKLRAAAVDSLTLTGRLRWLKRPDAGVLHAVVCEMRRPAGTEPAIWMSVSSRSPAIERVRRESPSESPRLSATPATTLSLK